MRQSFKHTEIAGGQYAVITVTGDDHPVETPIAMYGPKGNPHMHLFTHHESCIETLASPAEVGSLEEVAEKIWELMYDGKPLNGTYEVSM